MPTWQIVLLILLVLSLGGGGWGQTRYGYRSWSPLGVLLLVVVVLWLTGRIHFG